jgi:hypothetical protein
MPTLLLGSTVKVLVLELALTVLPLARAMAYTVWLPCARAVGWSSEKVPPPVAVTGPMLVPSTYTVTVLPAGAVPL